MTEILIAHIAQLLLIATENTYLQTNTCTKKSSGSEQGFEVKNGQFTHNLNYNSQKITNSSERRFKYLLDGHV